MQQNDFRKELAETAQRICTPGKGILAADEVINIFYTILVRGNHWKEICSYQR